MNTERIKSEHERLQAMAAASNGHMQVELSRDMTKFTVTLRNVLAPTGASASRLAIGQHHVLQIRLPEAYPDRMPVISFGTPIFHPNCWTSGEYCHGNQWFPARGLDDLVAELVRNIQLIDGSAFNLHSPANSEARDYYAVAGNVAQLRRRMSPVLIAPVRLRQSTAAASHVSLTIRRVLGDDAQPLRPVSIRRV